MDNRDGLKKAVFVLVFFGVFAPFSSNAFAGDKKVNWSISFSSFLPFNRSCHNHRDKEEIVNFRGKRYNYHEGRFYERRFSGSMLVIPPIGVIVKTIPSNSRVVMVKGDKYYCNSDIYYKSCHNGYIVVPPPRMIAYVKPCGIIQADGQSLVINIPNSNGSYTAVNLIKQKDGYTGPQGEYYPEHPTVEQLIALYGK